MTRLGGAAAMPLAARAQRAGKVWRMGFIAHGHESFHDELIGDSVNTGTRRAATLLSSDGMHEARPNVFQGVCG